MPGYGLPWPPTTSVAPTVTPIAVVPEQGTLSAGNVPTPESLLAPVPEPEPAEVTPLPVRPGMLSLDDTRLLERAAIAARKLYPGVVGDLLARECAMWKEEKLKFCNSSMPHRLVAFLLAEVDDSPAVA